MAGPKAVVIKWGLNYENELNLNDATNYYGGTVGTFNGPEMSIVLSDTIYSFPVYVRSKPTARVFSVNIFPCVEPNTVAYYDTQATLYRALYSGPLRLYVVRGVYDDPNDPRFGQDRYRYLECVCEQVKETEPGKFEAQLTAADPRWVLDQGTHTYQQNTTLHGTDVLDPDAGQYLPVNLAYDGSAPVEPYIIFQIGGLGGVYADYRDITVVNNSPNTLYNWPVCIQLGDLTALIGTKFHELGTNSLGVDPHSIRDIRIETLGGARKQFFLRDIGNHGGTWHTDVRLWTVLYKLEPGESKTLRVLYNNPNAPGSDIYPEQSDLKCMFNMYSSNNVTWNYTDFLPAWNVPQTRVAQWVPYVPDRWNIAWIAYRHDAFDNLTGEANVNCAGARATLYGPAIGATGVQLFCPIGISQVQYDARFSTNAKTPFLLRWQRRNLDTVDPPTGDPTFLYDSTSTMTAHTTATGTTGSTQLLVDRVTSIPSVEYFTAGQDILIHYNDGTAGRHTLTLVESSPLRLTFTPAIPSGVAVNTGTRLQVVKTVTGIVKTFNTTTGDYPHTISFILRGDHPEMTTGDWYFGGAENLTLTFSPAERLSVTDWASAPEVDLLNTKCHLRGRFGNPAAGDYDSTTGAPKGEYLRINYITQGIRDRVIVDCKLRKVLYQHWNDTIVDYDAAVEIMESLTREEIRFYWVHLEPGRDNQLVFIHDSDSNFRDNDVYVEYPELFW